MAEEHPNTLFSLLIICEEICKRMKGNEDLLLPDRIALAFFTKATHTLKAIVLLYENNLPEEAQSLVRILFETQVNFIMFVFMLTQDPESACKRLLDSMMLEKVKQQIACNFVGLDLVQGAPTPEDMLKFEEEAKSRYSEAEFQKLKRFGFTGMNIEQCAIKTGNQEMYNIIYRNFSRNVHATDYMELLLTQRPELSRFGPDYFESRHRISYQAVTDSIGRIIYVINLMFNLGFDDIVKLKTYC